MTNNINEVDQLLKYIKSLKGDYQNIVQHTNSRDIDTITMCCANIIEDNIPLPLSKKKSIKLFLSPIEKDIKSVSNEYYFSQRYENLVIFRRSTEET